MNLGIGVTPPLHRRFNEQTALRKVRNRYRAFHEKILHQVEILQKDKRFREKCQTFYQKGYKDWVILGAVFNCMLNWKGSELGLGLPAPGDQDNVLKLETLVGKTIYPADRFLGKDMDLQIQMHSLFVLPSYGFSARRRVFEPEVVEKFLRERMRHFDFDLSHPPLFGVPPGGWPKT